MALNLLQEQSKLNDEESTRAAQMLVESSEFSAPLVKIVWEDIVTQKALSAGKVKLYPNASLFLSRAVCTTGSSHGKARRHAQRPRAFSSHSKVWRQYIVVMKNRKGNSLFRTFSIIASFSPSIWTPLSSFSSS